MEDAKKKPRKNKPRKSNFLLTCFGFSFEPVLEGENPSKMVINITPTKEKLNGNEKTKTKKKKKKNLIRWFSSKTVPVDPTPASSEKVPGWRKRASHGYSSSAGDGDYKRSRSARKSTGDEPEADRKLPCPAADPPEITLADVPEENPGDQTSHGSEERIILGNGKRASDVEAGKGDRWQKRQSFVRKIDALRTPKSQPGSPEIKPKSNRTSPSLKIDAIQMPKSQPGSPEIKPKSNQVAPSRSTSFPFASHDKLTDKLVVKPVVKLETIAEKSSKETGSRNRDSVIGMSIMLVTLLIYLLCGRVCAVLCTCAWLYFVPLLRTMVGQDRTAKSGSVQNEPDLDSEEYKKRVILEGFLERRHRSPA